MSDSVPTRREELLADGALAWLDDADEPVFTALLADSSARCEFAALEQAAAAASLGLLEPAIAGAAGGGAADLVRLTAKLQADALAYFAAHPAATASRLPDRHRGWRSVPWLLAAASLLLLLWPGRGDDRPVPPAAARAVLLQSNAPVVSCAWQPGPSPARGEVAGDVVWDAARQEGFLRLRGLPALDPEHRYQLWIVDAARQGPPVDGGLLALPPDPGEVVVHVAARLPVREPAAFVLTVEAAHGAVVSAQEHVVAIARP